MSRATTAAARHAHEAAEPGLQILAPRIHEAAFPWLQVWGYVGSLVLTLGAYALVVQHRLPPTILLAVVLVLAGGQAALQLGVFMHLRESRGPAWQVPLIALALFTALGLIGMSMWIMVFKSGVS